MCRECFLPFLGFLSVGVTWLTIVLFSVFSTNGVLKSVRTMEEFSIQSYETTKFDLNQTFFEDIYTVNTDQSCNNNLDKTLNYPWFGADVTCKK